MNIFLKQAGTGLLFVVLLTSAAMSQPVWQATKASVTFTIRNAGFGVDGTFGGFNSTLRFDPASLATSKLTATVETATLNTSNGLRDSHLKKEEYFNVAAFPRISLTSVSIEKKTATTYVGLFDLLLKGTTRRVSVPFTFTQTGTKGQFVGQFTINRLDYKVGKSNMFLSDNVIIALKIDATGSN